MTRWLRTIVVLAVAAASVKVPVPSADLTDRVRVHGDTIEALADRGAFFGQVYPAISTDDGGDWQLDGPRFARAAADGANAVNHLAVSTNGTLVAWARVASIVKTRAYGAARWRATSFGSSIRSVTISGGRLIASTDPTTSPRRLATAYVSRNDGRTWRPAG